MATFIDGRKAVAAAGTREALSATSVPIRSVTIQAAGGNTGVVVIGGATVVAALATRRGIALAAGDRPITLTEADGLDDLRSVWVDAMVSGEAVTFVACQH